MLNRTINLYRNSFAGLSKEVWLLSTVMLINRSGMMVLPFLSIYLTKELGFTFGQAGFTMAGFGLGSVIGTLIGGHLTDRIGYYRVQFWSLLLTGIFFGVLMVMKTFWPFTITLFFLTVIADTFRPANFAAVRVYSKTENRTRSISLIRLAINLGIGIGPAVGGFMAATYGYNWLFIGDGVTCILAAFFFRAALKEKKVSAEEKENATAQMAGFSWLQDKVFLLFLGCTLLMAIPFMQILYTTGLAFKDLYGFTEKGIGLLFAINGFLIFLIEMPAVYVLEPRVRSLKLVGIGTIVIAASYFVLTSQMTWPVLAFISILLITFGEIISFPFSSTFAVERAPEGMVGRFMGMYGMVFSIGHIVAPVIGMQTIEHFGYSTLYWILGGMCLIGGLGFLGLMRMMARPQTALV